MTLLDASLALLEQEYQRAGRGDLYRLLQPSLTAQAEAPTYATVAATVDGDQQMDEEVRELFAALRW